MMEYAQLEQLCSSVRDVVKQVGLDIAISRKRIDEIVIEKKGVRGQACGASLSKTTAKFIT